MFNIGRSPFSRSDVRPKCNDQRAFTTRGQWSRVRVCSLWDNFPCPFRGINPLHFILRDLVTEPKISPSHPREIALLMWWWNLIAGMTLSNWIPFLILVAYVVQRISFQFFMACHQKRVWNWQRRGNAFRGGCIAGGDNDYRCVSCEQLFRIIKWFCMKAAKTPFSRRSNWAFYGYNRSKQKHSIETRFNKVVIWWK